ncbi:MAG TPA: family 10 glycosylhydrolase, partial [Cyclobacteriaceae bacterium]|nr:family 10 glycosylhydrolase [Cyclobacteriaceae bacterium]
FKKPEWFVTYGRNMYFDPGLPEARKHTINVIMDVVNRYNVDGVHFDDYFYPYRIAKTEFPDSASFEKYKGEFANKDDWRRNNVDLLIKKLNDSINQVKPHVQFGISPFGVWRNKSIDPAGSDTRAGQTCYDDLYADILKWMREGWIDYVVPQIYWSIGYEAAPYEVIAKWWNENSFNHPVIIGQGVYKVNANNDARWKEPDQIGKQIRLNRQLSQIKGSAYFSSKSFKGNPLGVTDSLKTSLYKNTALTPVWNAPQSVIDRQYPIMFIGKDNGIQLLWQESEPYYNLNTHTRYVIYRFLKNEKVDLSNSKNIIALPAESAYFDSTAKKRKTYTYVVTSLDRYNQESKPVKGYSIKNSKSTWKTLPITLK